MNRIKAQIGASAIILASGLSLVMGASPASAALVRPAIATNCVIAGTNFGGVDQHYWGWKATCNDTPTGEWQLVVTCESYGGKIVTVYGNVVTGNGVSHASCAGPNWEDDGIVVQDLQ